MIGTCAGTPSLSLQNCVAITTCTALNALCCLQFGHVSHFEHELEQEAHGHDELKEEH